LQFPSKFTQKGIFGLKINRLATLIEMHIFCFKLSRRRNRCTEMQHCRNLKLKFLPIHSKLIVSFSIPGKGNFKKLFVSLEFFKVAFRWIFFS
jgi:hypothetical protein